MLRPISLRRAAVPASAIAGALVLTACQTLSSDRRDTAEAAGIGAAVGAAAGAISGDVDPATGAAVGGAVGAATDVGQEELEERRRREDVPQVDTDGDGYADRVDSYPNDPSRY